MRKTIRSGVYQITNEVNGKFYIGSSKNIDGRWAGHRRDAFNPDYPTRSKLYPAIRKHGLENFTFIVLELCEPTREVLVSREQHYIDTLSPSYNILPKAASRLGSKASEETREKFRNKKISPEHIEALKAGGDRYRANPEIDWGAPLRGKTWDEILGEERAKERKEHQSKLRLENPIELSDEALARMRKHGFQPGHRPWIEGKTWSEEARQEMSQRAKERIANDPSVIDALHNGLKAAIERDPDGYLARQSAAGKKAWADPEIRERMLASREETFASPDYRQQLSERAQAFHEANPDHLVKMTEAARQANLGKPLSDEHRAKVSLGNRTSEKRKAHSESRRGVKRDPETIRKMSEAQQGKPKPQNRGRPSKPSASGHYGIQWRNDLDRWMVRIQNKKYGSFKTIEEAIIRRDEVAKSLNMPIQS